MAFFFCTLLESLVFAFFFSRSSLLRSGRESFSVEYRVVFDLISIEPLTFRLCENVPALKDIKFEFMWKGEKAVTAQSSSLLLKDNRYINRANALHLGNIDVFLEIQFCVVLNQLNLQSQRILQYLESSERRCQFKLFMGRGERSKVACIGKASMMMLINYLFLLLTALRPIRNQSLSLQPLQLLMRWCSRHHAEEKFRTGYP